MKNKMILNGSVMLAVLIMITVIFTGCNIENEVSINRPKQETENVFSNSEVMDDELVTESELGSETVSETETQNDMDTEADVEDTEVSDGSTIDSIGAGNTSSSNATTGNGVASTGNNSGGNTGKVDDKYQNELEEVSKLAQEIVSKVTTPSMSEFEKAMAIHDWLICNVVYELDGYLSGSIPYECYTAYGALKNGVAVCDGYTKAFNLLAEEAGLESMRVTGEADGGAGRGGHAWNKVKIDGVWYNVDVTWDDAVTDFEEEKDTLFTNGYEYFLLSDEDLSKDHFPDYETVECLVTYDRISLYKYAFSKVDYGENIAFAVTAEEVVKAINTFGKANISDIEIWFYDPEDKGFSIVMDAAKDAKYPNTGNATGHGNTKGMMQCYLTIVTEEVLSKASIFTDKDDYVEIINSKFDTGVTSFYLIYDTCDGSSFTNGFTTTFINYEFDFDWLPSYDGGKLYLYKFTLIGPKE